MEFFSFKTKAHAYERLPHSKRLCSQQQKVEQVSVQHTVNRHRHSQKLIRHLVLWPLSQITEYRMGPAISLFFSYHFLPLLVTFSFPVHCTLLSTVPTPVQVPSEFSVFCLSDVWERDLVELVLEVSVSQVSHRQRDMLLRQVGVLLGVLDSDIIVREISAYNEHR